MDFNQNSDNSNCYSDSDGQSRSRNGFSIASLMCGIAAVSLCCTGILGIPLGALSILFASFSKRKGEKMPGMSKGGIILSIFGITMGILMTVYSFNLVFHDPAAKEQINQMMEGMYGINLDEYIESLL